MRLYQVLVVVFALSESRFLGAAVQPSCGRLSGNVTVGQDIPPERWPWFAGLYRNGSFFCSGSLISDQWVLTRAYCLYRKTASQVTVVLGRNYKTKPDPNEVSREVSQISCNNLFNLALNTKDICLAKLSSPVNFSDHRSPVCLPAENTVVPVGTRLWVVGPSNNGDKIISLQIEVERKDECQRKVSYTITDSMICSKQISNWALPCVFSFGSPLLSRNDDQVWIQVGIAIYSPVCQGNAYTPLYTRVSSYQDWIKNIISESQLSFVSTSTSSPPRMSTTLHVEPPRMNTTLHVEPPRMNTTLHVTPPELCKTPPVVPPRTTCDRSIFGSSEKLSSTFFTSIFALLFSFVVLLV